MRKVCAQLRIVEAEVFGTSGFPITSWMDPISGFGPTCFFAGRQTRRDPRASHGALHVSPSEPLDFCERRASGDGPKLLEKLQLRGGSGISSHSCLRLCSRVRCRDQRFLGTRFAADLYEDIPLFLNVEQPVIKNIGSLFR
jgi:hypothetical protein